VSTQLDNLLLSYQSFNQFSVRLSWKNVVQHNPQSLWATCITFVEEILSLALPKHLLDFRYIASFRNQSVQRRLWSKIDVKFRTLHLPVKLWKEWGKYVNQKFKFSPKPNLWYTFGAQQLCGLGDSTHFPGGFRGRAISITQFSELEVS